MPLKFLEAVKDPVQERNNTSVWVELQRVDKLLLADRTTAPGATNDFREGHAVGTIWINTVAQDAYICISNAVSAAVWKKITP